MPASRPRPDRSEFRRPRWALAVVVVSLAGCGGFPDPGGPASRVAPDAPFPQLLPASAFAAGPPPAALDADDDPLLRRAAALRARAAALRRVDPGA